jgi:hypothetical protein
MGSASAWACDRVGARASEQAGGRAVVRQGGKKKGKIKGKEKKSRICGSFGWNFRIYYYNVSFEGPGMRDIF